MRFRLIGTIVMLCSIFVLQASYAQDALAPASGAKKEVRDGRLLGEIMALMRWDRKELGIRLGEEMGRREAFSPITVEGWIQSSSRRKDLSPILNAANKLIEKYGYGRLLKTQYLLGIEDEKFFKDALRAPELLDREREISLEDLRRAARLLEEKGNDRVKAIRDLLWMDNDEFNTPLGEGVRGKPYTKRHTEGIVSNKHPYKTMEGYLEVAMGSLRSQGNGLLEETVRLLGMPEEDFNSQIDKWLSGRSIAYSRLPKDMLADVFLEERLSAAQEMIRVYGPDRLKEIQARLNIADEDFAREMGIIVKGSTYDLKSYKGLKYSWGNHRVNISHLQAAYQLLIEPGRDFEIGNYVRHEAYAIYRNRSRDADAYKRDRPFKCWWYGRITDIVIGDGIWFEATHFSRKEAEEPSPSKGSPIKIKVLWPKIAKRLKRIEEKDFVHPQKNIFSTQLLAPQSAVRESISDELREKLRRYWEGVEFTETKTVPGTEIKVGIWRVKRPKSVVLSTVPICKEMIEIIQRDGDVNLIVVDPGSESIGAEGLYKLLDWAIKNELPEGCPLDPWTFTSENFKDKRVLALLKEASQRSTRPFSINTWARGRNNIYLEEETMPDLVEMELPIIYTFLGKSVLPRPVAEFTGKLVLSCLLDWDIDTFYGQGEGHRLSELLQESKKRYLEVVGRERDERKKESGAAIEGAVCRMWSRLLRVARKHDEIQQFVSEGRSRGAGVGPLRTVLEQEQIAAYEGEAAKDLGVRIGIVGVDEVTLRLMEVAIV